MTRIFDNIESYIDEALRSTLAVSARLDCSVGYFNLRGWGALCDAVEALPDNGPAPAVRLLIGMSGRPDAELREHLRIVKRKERMDADQANRLLNEAVQDFNRQLTLGIPSDADEATLRRLRDQMASGKVSVKLYLRHSLHAKLYLCHREDVNNPITGFVGSSNLTFAGLAHQGELNVDVLDHDAARKLAEWFKDRWEDDFSVSVTEDLIRIIEESWASDVEVPPYLVYLKMAYHLSKEAREGLLEFGLPESMKRDLLDYQAKAVQMAARRVLRRGGVMIGDVVGLGKTITATAIARLLQEEHNTETLIICPKNLVRMWKGYVAKYRLYADVLPLSMVTRDLRKLPRYRVVIIDESHNLRSEGRKDYAEIKDYIQRNDSKVILLTATPYNKRFLDVASQLALFVDNDDNLGIRPERGILARGEYEFMRKCDGKASTLGAFRCSEEPEDWRRLMSLFLVRRTRRFIKENYAQLDENGRSYLCFANGDRFTFPDRTAKTLRHVVDAGDPAAVMMSEATLDAITSLRLPRYRLGKFLIPDGQPNPDEIKTLEGLERASGNLSGFTRTMLFKRLSSCGASFVLSLERHLLRNWVFIHALETGAALPIGHVDDTLWEDEDADVQDALLEEMSLPGKWDPEGWRQLAVRRYTALAARGSRSVSWVSSTLFDAKLAEELRADCETLQALLTEFGDWRQEEDSKLDALQHLVENEHAGQKVVVFTEYRDTAEYVATALKQRGVADVESVSGSTDDPTVLAYRFSPVSNEALAEERSPSAPIRVLVATDVLSEGQNLQDAHIVVNYDLPWAIIKIIQRAGRVDRIGQHSSEVLVYSFLPADDVESVIRLRQRIAQRLKENAIVFGSDEQFFGEEGEERFIKGLYDENGEIADVGEESEEEVDWTSNAFEIWRRATEEDTDLAARVEALQDVVYSTKRERRELAEGVLVYVQTEYGYDSLAFTTTLGETRMLSPSEALVLAGCAPDEPAAERLSDHHELVAMAVTGPLQSPSSHLEGSLTGVRKRCWDRMKAYRDEQARRMTLFGDERLDQALDAMYARPLQEGAVQLIANALRERTQDDLAALIVQLNEDERLCVEEHALQDDDIRIVCSLGLRR